MLIRNRQILTLSLAEQTIKLMRKFEDRVLPDRMAEKL
jgi:solute carrier family 25 protein 34/35